MFDVPVVPKPVVSETESERQDVTGEGSLDPVRVEAVAGKTHRIACERHVASRDGEALEILLSLLDPDFQGKFLPARTEVKVLHHASDAFPVAVVNLGVPPCRRIAGKTDTPAEPYPVRNGAGTVRASSYKAAHRLRIYPSLVRVAPEWKSSASGA